MTKLGTSSPRGGLMSSFLAVVVVVSGAVAQSDDGIEVKLGAKRSTLLSFQAVDLTVTITNRGTKPTPALSRAMLSANKTIIAALPGGPGSKREGKWAKRVGKAPRGGIGALQPGESFTTPVRVEIPEGMVGEKGGVVYVQWVGRKGFLKGRRSEEVQLNVRAGDKPIVTVETSKGSIVLELWPDKAPNHVANFVTLARRGFFSGLTWHRVIANFMVQTGCPNGDGMGNPGYTIPAEINDVDFKKGILGMARGPSMDSAGSQFFVMVADRPALNKKYTAFGRVLEGQEIADQISRVPTHKDPPQKDRPITPIKLVDVLVELPEKYELPAVVKTGDKKPEDAKKSGEDK